MVGVETYIPHIKRTAHRMLKGVTPGYLDADDLTSAGCVGLVEAMSRYRPDSEATLNSFAWRRIRGAMLDEIRQMGPLSRRQHERGESIPDILRIDYVSQDGVMAAEYYGYHDKFDEKIAVRRSLNILKDRERDIIISHFWIGENQYEIAKRYGVCESRISQIIRDALKKLRRVM